MNEQHQNNTIETYGISRKQARRHPYPKHDVAAEQPCRRARGGPRAANHTEHVLAASDIVADEQSPEEIARAALAFVNGYLLTWRRDPAAARLTPKEKEIGATVLDSMISGRVYLESCHRNGRSLEEIAARFDRPLRNIAKKYVEAVETFAWNAIPLLEACCKQCRRQMPDVIFDATLRCPECLALLPEHTKPIPDALEIEELKVNCTALGTTWTAPAMDIYDVYEKRVKDWKAMLELDSRTNRGHPFEDALKKDNEAWAFIKAFRLKYGR